LPKKKQSEARRLIKKLGTKTLYRKEEILEIFMNYLLDRGVDPDQIAVESSGLEEAVIGVWHLEKRTAKTKAAKAKAELANY
jgi:hypothetical protein